MKLRRPSPALAVAFLALFVSLGGVSYGVATGFIDSREIRDNTVRTRDIRNNDVRGRDIRNSTILGRDVALNTLRGADIDESRLDIDESRLAKVPDADRLDGVDSQSFLRRDQTGFLGLALAANWIGGSGGDAPQVDVDPLGNVQLRGIVERQAGASDTAIVLPLEARPPSTRRFAVWAAGGPVNVTVGADGSVRPDSVDGEDVSLDGVVFRANAP